MRTPVVARPSWISTKIQPVKQSRRMREMRRPVVVVEVARRVTREEGESVIRAAKVSFPGRRVLVATDGWSVRP